MIKDLFIEITTKEYQKIYKRKIREAKKIKTVINEKEFRNSLKKLDNIYRSVKLNPNDKIDSTVSFMVLKYISDKEEENWSFNIPRDDGIIKLWNDFEGNFKNCFDNAIKNFLSGDYGKEYSNFKRIVNLSQDLNNQNFKEIYLELNNYELHGADFDLFGVIYETFADSNEKKKFGEYYTRRHITKTIARILLHNEKNYVSGLKICDPCCGTGGFLTEAFKVLRGNWEREGNLSRTNINHLKENIFFGFDDRDESIARAELNMFLVSDGHTNIKKRDTLKQFQNDDGLEEEEYDYILSNPPYGNYKGGEKIENFWSKEKRSEMLFVDKIIKATKRGGRMALVVPDGILEAPSREYFRIDILYNVDIEIIISLPKFAFAPYTKEKTYVLIMKRKQKEDEGRIQTRGIWHYIVDFDGYANSDKRYETKAQDEHGNYMHYDLPHLESSFKEQKETNCIIQGKEVLKSKLVSMNKVKSENFHNFLSEFYLRPIEIEEIAVKKLVDELENLNGEKINLMESAGGFEEVSIGTVFDFIGESNITEEYSYHHKGEYPVYSGQTENQGIFCKIDSFVEETPCLTFTTYGSAGNLFYREGKFTIGRNCMGLRPKKEFDKKIDLKWFANTQKQLFLKNTRGDKEGQKSLNKIILERVIFQLPKNIKYQKEIAKLYEMIVIKRNKLISQIRKLELLKKKQII